MTGRSPLTPVLLFLGITVCTVSPARAQMEDHASDQPLRVAAEIGFQPFNFREADGTVTGFSYELSEEISKRLGRPGYDVVDIVWSNIFAALHAKRVEYIIGPTTITPQRAEEMLFSEPYFDVALAFLTSKDSRFGSMDDVRGKTVGVTSGSVQDDWMKANAEKHGIAVQRFDKTADAVQAVAIRRIDAYMTTEASARWTVKKQPLFAADVAVSTGGSFGLPFRKNDVEFRNHVEEQLECMKRDGTLSAIYQKWFDVEPAPDSSTATVYPGYGAPGWPGHMPEAAPGKCS